VPNCIDSILETQSFVIYYMEKSTFHIP